MANILYSALYWEQGAILDTTVFLFPCFALALPQGKGVQWMLGLCNCASS